MSDLRLALELTANTTRLSGGLSRGERDIHRWTQGVKREFDSLGRVLGGFESKLAGLGLGLGAGLALRESARLDKMLGQVGQTAGTTKSEVAGLRQELFGMSKITGANVDDLREGHAALIASGQSWKAATEDLKAINIAMGVTGAKSETLAGGLTVAGEAFQFDLEKPGLALELLDKMTVAGRKGNAELENLASIFARVGVNASSAGLRFDKTLAFLETLSLVERQPERLATLADSTLRLFNNIEYMQTAEQGSKLTAMLLNKRKGAGELEFPEDKALKKLVKSKEFEALKGGVKFFDDKGGRRDPVAVLKDLREQFRLMRTDEERTKFLGNVFDKMDLDTVKGMRTLLQGDALDKVSAIQADIEKAGGTLQRDLPGAINNAVDQAGRLKATLREAADQFAQPINAVITKGIKYTLDSKDKGGLGLSGKELIEYGAGGGLVALLGARYGGKLMSGLAGKVTGIGAGVAAGKALQEVAGVQPVFVTNWPAGGVSGAPAIPASADAAVKAGSGAAAGWGARAFGAARAATLPGLALSGGLAAGLVLNKELQGTAFMDGIDSGVRWFFAPRAGRGTRGAGAAPMAGPSFADMGGEFRDWFMAPRPGRSGRGGVDDGGKYSFSAPQVGTEIGESAKRVLDGALSEQTRAALDMALKVNGAGDAFARRLEGIDLGGEITLRIDSPVPTRVTGLRSNSPGLSINVDTGPTNVLPQ